MSTIATGGKSELARNARAKDRSAAATKGHARRKAAKRRIAPKAVAKPAPKPQDLIEHEPIVGIATELDTLTRANQLGLVYRAVNMLRTEKRSGNDSTIWLALPAQAQHHVAARWLVDRASLDEIVTEIPAKLRVSKSALSRWLRPIQEKFRELSLLQANRNDATAEMDALRGDLASQVGVYCSGLLRFFLPVVNTMQFGDLDNKSHHLLVRVAEFGATLVKVDAERKHKEAQTAKLVDALRAIANDSGGTPREDPVITARRAVSEAFGVPFVEPGKGAAA